MNKPKSNKHNMISTEKFREELKRIAPELELMSEYKGAHPHVKVKDADGIIYNIQPTNLRQGKAPTIKSAENKTSAFIVSSQKIFKDKYDYSETVYVDAQTKVLITCKKHNHTFSIRPNHHLRKGRLGGCPICGEEGNVFNEGKRLKAKAYFYTFMESSYPKLKILDEYITSTTYLRIQDEDNIVYNCMPYNLIYNGAPTIQSAADKTQAFIIKAKKIHGNAYDYSKSKYITDRTKLTIICPAHGEFKKTPNKHLSGEQGCPDCSIEELSKRYTKTTEQFIRDAREVHGDRYDYSKVEYINSYHLITIICSIHGEFKQTPNSHLSNHGCQKCANIIIAKSQTKTTEYFVEKAVAIHGDDYDYSLVDYRAAKIPIEIICKKHNESFMQTPDGHVGKKAGCPKCALENGGFGSVVWAKMAKRSKNKDSYKLYVIEVDGNGEHFYKVGLTFKTIKQRFARSKDGKGMPAAYEYKILRTYIDESADDLDDMESHLKHILRKDHYRPLIKFGGHATECFSKIDLDLIDTIAENHINPLQSQ